MKHLCHAYGCNKQVPPKLLMCPHHWRLVPKTIQREVWEHYVPGQEVRKDPTDDYLKVQQRAVVCVIVKEQGFSDTQIPWVLENMMNHMSEQERKSPFNPAIIHRAVRRFKCQST